MFDLSTQWEEVELELRMCGKTTVSHLFKRGGYMVEVMPAFNLRRLFFVGNNRYFAYLYNKDGGDFICSYFDEKGTFIDSTDLYYFNKGNVPYVSKNYGRYKTERERTYLLNWNKLTWIRQNA